MSYGYTIEMNMENEPKTDTNANLPVHPSIIQAQTVLMVSQARLNEADLFLRGLVEVRMALNYPMVSEDDNGLGERAKLEPMFDQIDQKRLQKRYIHLLDRYMGYTKKFMNANAFEPENLSE